jgi:dipeptidase E
MRDILLLSTSAVHGSRYLEYCEAEIGTFLHGRETVLFIPYARPGGALHADYTKRTRQRFEAMGFRLDGIHEAPDPVSAVRQAKAIFVGGGNTFVLLRELYRKELLPLIRQRAVDGMPYLGSSAGSNVAGLSIGTTNDMPVVHPPRFEALGLIPFNVNPHYLDPDPGSTHMGETRETRIREFHHFNPQPVIGLREGSMMRVQGDRAWLAGQSGGILFRSGSEPQELEADADVSFLLAG